VAGRNRVEGWRFGALRFWGIDSGGSRWMTRDAHRTIGQRHRRYEWHRLNGWLCLNRWIAWHTPSLFSCLMLSPLPYIYRYIYPPRLTYQPICFGYYFFVLLWLLCANLAICLSILVLACLPLHSVKWPIIKIT